MKQPLPKHLANLLDTPAKRARADKIIAGIALKDESKRIL